MATIENPTALKVEHLLHSVKQLSSVELDEFTRKFTEWQRQQKAVVGEDVDPEASDAEVLASIRANLLLPEKENQRYWQLRRKSDDETLTDDELPEYQELVRRFLKRKEWDIKYPLFFPYFATSLCFTQYDFN